MTRQAWVWAYIEPDGRILADTHFKDEADTWKIALGWPDDEEIEEAKRRGCRVELVGIAIDER